MKATLFLVAVLATACAARSTSSTTPTPNEIAALKRFIAADGSAAGDQLSSDRAAIREGLIHLDARAR